MSTKGTTYKTEKAIYNGTTTIAYGFSGIKTNGKFGQVSVKLFENIKNLCLYGFETKGVAKLSPGDTYSQATGIKIATRKAEIKGNRAMAKRLRETLKTICEYEGELIKLIDELDARATMAEIEIRADLK